MSSRRIRGALVTRVLCGPVVPLFRRSASGWREIAPASPFFICLSSIDRDDRDTTPRYWRQHISGHGHTDCRAQSPARFCCAVEARLAGAAWRHSCAYQKLRMNGNLTSCRIAFELTRSNETGCDLNHKRWSPNRDRKTLRAGILSRRRAAYRQTIDEQESGTAQAARHS
jgi:hypothetical protein